MKLVQDVKEKRSVLFLDHSSYSGDSISVQCTDIILHNGIPTNLAMTPPSHGSVITSTVLELFCLLDRSIGDADYFFRASLEGSFVGLQGRVNGTHLGVHEYAKEVDGQEFQKEYWPSLKKLRSRNVLGQPDKEVSTSPKFIHVKIICLRLMGCKNVLVC